MWVQWHGKEDNSFKTDSAVGEQFVKTSDGPGRPLKMQIWICEKVSTLGILDLSQGVNKNLQALFGCACIHLSPHVLKWIGVELN
jgi:hypothetical protein